MNYNRKEYQFFTYIMANHERTCFYVGFCNDIARRAIEHMHGFGCEFSRKYKTFDLVYFEEYKYNNEAIQREKQWKVWRRDKKMNLIKIQNPELRTLNQELFNSYGYTDKDVEEIVVLLKEKYGMRP